MPTESGSVQFGRTYTIDTTKASDFGAGSSNSKNTLTRLNSSQVDSGAINFNTEADTIFWRGFDAVLYRDRNPTERFFSKKSITSDALSLDTAKQPETKPASYTSFALSNGVNYYRHNPEKLRI